MGYDGFRIDNIRFSYKDTWAIQDVSFSIDRGSFWGLIGPNGSGKTTLLKLLCGLLIPQQGRVTFLERDVNDWDSRKRAQWIAYVHQDKRILYSYTVLEVVLMGRSPYASLFGFDRPEDIDIAKRALERVGLLRLADRPIQAVSGGEHQMVHIARALAQQPKVILLDEPTAFLDLSHQLNIYKILYDLNREEGMTVVVISHDLNMASQFCKDLLLLKNGRIVASGPPSLVITPDLIEQVFQCRTLVDEHPSTGKPRVTLISETVST